MTGARSQNGRTEKKQKAESSRFHFNSRIVYHEKGGGRAISDDSFIAAVLEIEARDVTPQGLTLTASHTLDNWIVFTLKMNGTNENCASFEFLPESGEFRRGASCD